jgi:hypothetical protein
MTVYHIEYKWNGGITRARGYITQSGLDEVLSNPRHEIVSLREETPQIIYKTSEGCERCTIDPYVPHYNCICGKRKAHCTADSCY